MVPSHPLTFLCFFVVQWWFPFTPPEVFNFRKGIRKRTAKHWGSIVFTIFVDNRLSFGLQAVEKAGGTASLICLTPDIGSKPWEVTYKDRAGGLVLGGFLYGKPWRSQDPTRKSLA